MKFRKANAGSSTIFVPTIALNWLNLLTGNNLNGWVPDPNDFPQYAVDSNGLVRLRGNLDGSNSTALQFCIIPQGAAPTNLGFWGGYPAYNTAGNGFIQGNINITAGNPCYIQYNALGGANLKPKRLDLRGLIYPLDTNIIVAPPTWINFPGPINGWAQSAGDPPLRYFIDSRNVIHLTGTLDGHAATSTTVCQMPAGYRPASTQQWDLGCWNTAGTGFTIVRVTIDSNGILKVSDTAGNNVQPRELTLAAIEYTTN